MKISIENIPLSSEEQIIIRCWEVNEQIKGIVRYVKSNDQVLLGYDNKKMTSLNHVKSWICYYFLSLLASFIQQCIYSAG